QLELERGDAALEERLLLLGVLVLGVLGEIAVELRLVDAGRDPGTIDGDELSLEPLEAFRGQVDGLRVHVPLPPHPPAATGVMPPIRSTSPEPHPITKNASGPATLAASPEAGRTPNPIGGPGVPPGVPTAARLYAGPPV